MHASEGEGDWAGITKVLLEGGADPTVTCREGCLALHVSARHGGTNTARILVSEAPHTLFDRTLQGKTPLYLAAYEGQWRTVSFLLSVAQLHRVSLVAHSTEECPLMAAVVQACLRGPSQQHGKVVDVLLDSGRGVLQRNDLLSSSVRCVAILGGRVDILQQLLDVDGEGRRGQWARSSFRCKSMLHYAAGFARLSCVNALLRAGADEIVSDGQLRRPDDVVGSYGPIESQALPFPGISDLSKVDKDPATISAIRRMLERGPAYRARSWAYPAFGETRVAAPDQNRATCSEPAEKHVSPLHVRIYRRQDGTTLPIKCFAAAVNRCAGREDRDTGERLKLPFRYRFVGLQRPLCQSLLLLTSRQSPCCTALGAAVV